MPSTQAITFTQHYLTADQVLSPYIWSFYASFLIAFVFTPILRSVAIYYGIVDKPDLVRKLHAQPVAYLGGVAVFMGWLGGMAATQFTPMHMTELGVDDRLRVPLAIILAAIIILILGLWDDILHLSPRVKIFGQLLAAVALLSQGIGMELTHFLVNNVAIRIESRLGMMIPLGIIDWTTWVTSVGATVGLVVFCCNASNLMDGLDGLCGGVTGINAIGFVFLAVIIAQPESIFADSASFTEKINGDGLRVVIALALLGGVLGFVPYNFNPASIFMGDT
ncbi:MAG: undecaprenyl/decaprenyl-phosphate alpha-N-acetylglucosaminyl 1-phosphate transferase, partial [Burkholderiales bacterium]|nr:undecaprenyl/decaprenyl-phosphate alpha-N-acetylglucosaminyl 1-phosphate transferase [Phycisphaerae bacterium]